MIALVVLAYMLLGVFYAGYLFSNEKEITGDIALAIVFAILLWLVMAPLHLGVFIGRKFSGR